MPKTLRYIWDGKNSPSQNMARDEALMMKAEGLTLRCYQWQPFGLSLGYFQDFPDSHQAKEFSEQGIEIVRRLTGGGAILHGNELTYSLSGLNSTAPFHGQMNRSYRVIHDCFLRILKNLGVHAEYPQDAPRALKKSEQPFLCFARSTSLDLCIDDKKLLGSAKRCRSERAMQHGSITLRKHELSEDSAELLSHCAVNAQELGLALATELAKALKLSLCIEELDESTRIIAKELAESRYGNPQWTKHHAK